MPSKRNSFKYKIWRIVVSTPFEYFIMMLIVFNTLLLMMKVKPFFPIISKNETGQEYIARLLRFSWWLFWILKYTFFNWWKLPNTDWLFLAISTLCLVYAYRTHESVKRKTISALWEIIKDLSAELGVFARKQIVVISFKEHRQPKNSPALCFGTGLQIWQLN